MTKLLSIYSLSILLFASSCALAEDESAAPVARIAKFAGNRAAAISYTFDDNLRDQYTVAVPILNEFGLKGTFFVIPGATAETPEEGKAKDGKKRAWGGISWPELKEMAEQGHEIASHTWSHPNLKKLSPDEIEEQFTKANEAIQSHIGLRPLTLAFPFNASTPEIQTVAAKHYAAFRTFQKGTSGGTTTASLDAWADELVEKRQWGVLMVHGVTTGYAAMRDASVLRDHLKHMKGRVDTIWIDTFANVARYVKEREDAKLEAFSAEGGITFTLTGTLDSKIFDVPLTVVLPRPSGKVREEVTRDGKSLPVTKDDNSLLIDVTPGPNAVTVRFISQ